MDQTRITGDYSVEYTASAGWSRQNASCTCCSAFIGGAEYMFGGHLNLVGVGNIWKHPRSGVTSPDSDRELEAK